MLMMRRALQTVLQRPPSAAFLGNQTGRLSLSRMVAPSSFYQQQPALQQQQQHRGILSTTFLLPSTSSTSSEGMGPGTKLVATIGPTSEQAQPLLEVMQAGVKIMRLNFSHATVEEVELRSTNWAAAQEALTPSGAARIQATRAVLLDTKGPEIRTGKLAHDDSGHETVTLEQDQTVTLQTKQEALPEGGSTAQDLFVDYPSLATAVAIGGKVLLDDGAMILTVTATDTASGSVTCSIDNTGDLRSRAGVNLPFADTSDLPAMSDKDKADIAYGMTGPADVDFVAASFVQTAAGVREIKQYMADVAQQAGWPKDRLVPALISKIETASALQHFDDILQESDGIMVARGDLGVEIPLAQVVNAQKEMVAACNAVGKPVIVATQMLESMSKNPRPTRAEVADVTNAVYDGADCVMTSGETAKGRFPTETALFMREICAAAEGYAVSGAVGQPARHEFVDVPETVEASVAKAAVAASLEQDHDCAALVVTGSEDILELTRLVSAFRPVVPIYAMVTDPKHARRLQLHKHVHPILVDRVDGDSVKALQAMELLPTATGTVIVVEPTGLHIQTL